MSVRRVAALAALAVATIAAAVYVAARIERDSAIHASRQAEASQQLLTAMLDQETGARGYFETHRRPFLQPWYAGITEFAAAMDQSRHLIGGDPTLRRALAMQNQISVHWHADALAEIRRLAAGGPAPTVTLALADKATMDRFRAANAAYAKQLASRRDASLETASWRAAALVGALTVALMLIGVLSARRVLAREARAVERQRELHELLQVSASEDESRRLLISHVRRLAPSAGAAVLSRNNSDDRLEPMFAEDAEQTPLASIEIDQQRPRACMAVRLSRPYEHREGERPLATCEVCGKTTGDVVCEPLLVGGQVIGSVLVASGKTIDARQRAAIRESVVQAAPIMANQRNLALAERRAASDALTGLPNRRAADETIKRMVAQAGRAMSPLGVVLLDLDRFKQINDLHGHEQGDKALATIGQVIASTLRTSDFASRYGGEEFLILLPDTDRESSAAVAEKIRRAIEQSELPNIGAITGSLGVACLPEDGVEPEHLVRKADRALYLAKAHGRNRVEVTEPTGKGWLVAANEPSPVSPEEAGVPAGPDLL
ncbi:MAG: diguanylate cyclase [Solirubrobacteraceae bacterium]